LGEVSDTAATEVQGVLYSGVVDNFQVTKIESSNPLLKGEAVPMPEEQRKELGAKIGYRIQVSLSPGLPVGTIREKLSIETDARGGANFTVNVHGRRPGPVRIMAMPGSRWYAEDMQLPLGRFPAAAGAKATLSLFVTGLGDRELEFQEVESDPAFLRVRLEPDPKFQVEGQKRYFLHVEVPPGMPPANRVRDNAAKFKVKTNHPDAERIEISVQYLSL
jgi:hypothetical protein